ncbi:bidirectional sugar transporter SWEET4 [Sorghum bicolor]|uniref:bidirectional sugar transporter SWEET4 n=1 Tax=Sorghum bicolor TaxID=4558 RepID=UPI00081AD19B|nr:bidirectional sugar transporter SWEET4 [Sorghum bicolor]|eukprot:XP_021311709.1 bidirectional sugar transporter SWEET4 [Sorghum bicolor]
MAGAQPNIAQELFGILGDITCGGLFLSPVATMWDISRHGSSEQYSASPYLAGLLNCAVWLLYGYVHPNGKWVFGINIVGSLLQLLYIVIFVYYTTVDDVRYQIYYMLFGAGVCLVGIMALVFGQAHSTEQKCMGFGLAGVATGIGMYAAPLIQLRSVVERGNVEGMSLLLIGASLGNSAVWTVYACLGPDFYVLVPNLIGALCTVVQLVVYFRYNNNNNNNDA